MKISYSFYYDHIYRGFFIEVRMAQALKKQGTGYKKYTAAQKMKAIQIINGDHSEFSGKVLQVYNKAGHLVPFKHNKAQIEFFKVWEECMKRFGYVRIITVKARRHGISTAVAGKFYHNTIKAELRGKKCNSLVLAQDDDSSTALFDITKAFQENAGDFAPRALSMSEHKLKTQHSTYLCQTAGQQKKEKGKGKGRGMTAQQIHLSEVAHIDNAQVLASSLLLTVGQELDTAVVLESTANGEGDYFHQQYLAAKAGKTDFLPFFAPWFWDEANQCEPPEGFELSDEDRLYRDTHDLTMRQMAWRRLMENKLGLTEAQGKLMFKQEFPADDVEAFSYSSTDSYIKQSNVIDALNRPPKVQGRDTAVIAAYDPANKGSEMGKDRDAFGIRHGSHIFGLELPAFDEDDFDARVRFLQDKLDNKALGIDMLFMDAGGGGYQLKSRLKNLGYGDRVRYVEFGSAADDQTKAPLKRDEMFIDFNDLLTDKHDPLSICVEEKYKSAVITDLTATGFKHDHKNRPKMESKESIKSRLGISTDIADMLIMLVAAKVKKRITSQTGRTLKCRSSFNPYAV
jgi:hypothetical protein